MHVRMKSLRGIESLLFVCSAVILFSQSRVQNRLMTSSLRRVLKIGHG